MGTQQDPQWAVRDGDWKLLHNPLQSKKGELDPDQFMLVNVKRDVSETVNEAAHHP
ncbi:hypothetical protein [Xanthocytophaga flava]|uniref:hypothetical protein n=1 Tax=Xanthocytophaga flava TaxID=3048013 RepID=UPI0028D69B84|nr:hypothetical protein [Xanthocytophaga flavus]MDJ1473828.1 hypothetical protein [Xanthocytophaga flavus]